MKGLAILVTACMLGAAQAAPPVIAIEGPYEPTVQCPPSDGYAWHRGPLPAKHRVFWAVVSDETMFVAACDERQYSACVTHPDGETAIVWTRIPRDWHSPGMVEHEECHALGWIHDVQHASVLR